MIKQLLSLLLFFVFLFISNIYCQEISSDLPDSNINQNINESTTDISMNSNELLLLKEEMSKLKKEFQKLQEENEARKSLEITDEEREEKEKEILSAAGRQYTLLRKGIMGIENTFKYTFHSTDTIKESNRIEHESNHTMGNDLLIEYALLDNLTLNISIPLVYKHDKNSTTNSLTVNDVGDISFGGQFQPMKAGGNLPSTILYGNFIVPSGRSPYKIMIGKDLSTGSGYYSLNAGMSMNKTVDPIVAFGNLSLSYNHQVTDVDQKYGDARLEEVEPGNSIGYSMGIGYALSYKVSMFMSYQYFYQFTSKYYFKNGGYLSSGSQVSSMLNFGTRWNLTPKQAINVSLGIGLTNDSPDFTLSVRIPFEYKPFEKIIE